MKKKILEFSCINTILFKNKTSKLKQKKTESTNERQEIMKILMITYFIIFFSINLFAEEIKEYKFSWYPRIQVDDDIINFPDSSKFETYNTSGVWEDNFGNYGIMKSVVSQIINKKDEITLDGYCEARDSEEEKFWMSLKRKSFNKAGVGKSKYLFTKKKYKTLDGKECPYAAQLIEGGGVFKLMCKLSRGEYKILEQYTN